MEKQTNDHQPAAEHLADCAQDPVFAPDLKVEPPRHLARGTVWAAGALLVVAAALVVGGQISKNSSNKREFTAG